MYVSCERAALEAGIRISDAASLADLQPTCDDLSSTPMPKLTEEPTTATLVVTSDGGSKRAERLSLSIYIYIYYNLIKKLDTQTTINTTQTLALVLLYQEALPTRHEQTRTLSLGAPKRC